MNIVRKKEALVLFVGDIFVLLLSLYLALTLRYGRLPSAEIMQGHIIPFSILFLVAVLIGFIAGLYEKHTLVLKRKLPIILTQVQIANALVSIAFFYFIPYFVITPKITLFIYLVISLIIMVAWRMSVAQTFGARRKYHSLLIAQGREAHDLYEEINQNPRYGTTFIKWIDTSLNPISGQEIRDIITNNKISLVVADFSHQKVDEIMPILYSLIFSGVQFADVQKLYEEIFDRVPLSFVNDSWFIENISSSPKTSFDIFKRLTDIVISALAGFASLIFYPFVYIAIKLDDRGHIFIHQERVGRNNTPIKIRKFRTMTVNDQGRYGVDGGRENKVTRVGKFLRKSRIDELPQLWNVLFGDISMIGPRPELPNLVKHYEDNIPYYSVRHIIKPGLSGWAQIYHENHPHHSRAVTETQEKLSYDLYYVKNRSLLLDLKITLQTLKTLISFAGK